MSVVTLRFPESLQGYFPATVEVVASSVLDACKLLFSQFKIPECKIPIAVQGYSSLNLLDTPLFRNVEVQIMDLRGGYSGAGGGKSDNQSQGTKLLAIGVTIMLFAVGFGTEGSKLAEFVFNMGLSIALNGLMVLLTPTPKDEEQKELKSRYFSGDKMTTQMGTPVPIVLGTHRIYGHLLSFNIDARNFDGLDRPKDSPFFTAKVNENLPQGQELQRFYGYIQAGAQLRLLQKDNAINRTGQAL